ncbi:MAG: M20/M25/M40 family metallo-hydrolase [Terriglobales bacterium]
MRKILFTLLILVTTTAALCEDQNDVCKPCIRAHEHFLASDAMQGRGSATANELLAAEYIAAQLEQYGIQPALPGGFIQTVVQDVDLSKLPLDRMPAQLSRGFKNAVQNGKLTTRNVIGIVRGTDPKLKDQVILLSAHMDHMGVVPEEALNGDAIFNGADDDASGVTAVLEMARSLANSKPNRTIMFAFFGSEELGGYGAKYFLAHPPVPLTSIVANLEFEMIGRSDPAVAPHTLWLTGFERSNLGPELAKHGARLVQDPHPEAKFFMRSDNYTLAKQGVVAHTVSSFGLHKEYHRPNDDIAHLDFDHMSDAIGSMIKPIRWLVDSDFTPEWLPGQKP